MTLTASITTGLSGRDDRPVGGWGLNAGNLQHGMLGLPFLPLFKDSQGRWRWWCPILTRDGRCGDYENRPALCRSYKAGEDRICAMHRPEPVQEAECVAC